MKKMKQQNDWNPEHYLKYGNERTQPSIDLVNRIRAEHAPVQIADIGCGPGNSSQVLMQRWPGAKLTGVDNSPAMIEKARRDYPHQNWILADASQFNTDQKFSLIFSNAAIQWIPNHEALFERFFDLLEEEGTIAVQFPQFQEMVLGKVIDLVSRKERWKRQTEDCGQVFTCHSDSYYYNLLSDKVKSMDIWETDYIHVMPNHLSIVDWIKSTGMKPYLERISGEQEKKDFENEVLAEIKTAYPRQENGCVLFSFKRFFLIAYR